MLNEYIFFSICKNCTTDVSQIFLILTFWRECTFAENPEGGRGQVAFQKALNLISHQINCEKKIMVYGIFNRKNYPL